MRNPTYERTWQRYDRVRETAHRVTAARFERLFPRMLLSNITPAVINAYRSQWRRERRHEQSRDWDWETIISSFRADPKQFQIAIWHHHRDQERVRKDLHAMAIGRTSSAGAEVRLHYIEAYPADEHPFRGSVFAIVDYALTFYGFLINARQAAIVDPLPGIKPFYEAAGYVRPDGQVAPEVLIKPLEVDDDRASS